jgi:hypothetical protein
MLLCEVMVQLRIMPKARLSAYEGAVQQDCERLLSLALQLPTSASIFKRRCWVRLKSFYSQTMFDEGIALL